MSVPFFSIVIPIYNVEKYLNQCLASISSQGYSDWECILVDDGSKDNSGIICDEFAKNDSRFIIRLFSGICEHFSEFSQ